MVNALVSIVIIITISIPKMTNMIINVTLVIINNFVLNIPLGVLLTIIANNLLENLLILVALTLACHLTNNHVSITIIITNTDVN